MESCNAASQKLTMSVVGELLHKNLDFSKEVYSKIMTVRAKLISSPNELKSSGVPEDVDKADLLSGLHRLAKEHSELLAKIDAEINSILDCY